jgi:hypothetical protein
MVIFFAVGVGAAFAQTTYYVDRNGDDVNNNGLVADDDGQGAGPFATIAKALTLANEDDTLSIETGAYSEPFSFDSSLVIVMRNSGTTDTLSITNFTISSSDTVEILQGETGLVFEVNNLTLGGGTTAKTLLDVSDASEFFVINGEEMRTVTYYDSIVVNGSIKFPDSLNVTYDLDFPHTTLVNEFPANLGSGTFAVTADTGFTLGQSISAAAFQVLSGSGSDDGLPVVKGSAGVGVTLTGAADTTIIQENTTLDFTVGNTTDNLGFHVVDTLNGSITISDLATDSVNFKADTDTAYVLGSITIGENAIFDFDNVNPLYLSGSFTNNGVVKSNNITSQLIFYGENDATFAPGGITDGSVFPGVITEKTDAEVVANSNFKVTSSDSAFVVRTGTFDMGEFALNSDSTGFVLIRPGATLNSGTVAFTGNGTTARLAGLGFNSINTLGTSLIVNPSATDSTTFSGDLTIGAGSVTVSNKALNLIGNEQTLTVSTVGTGIASGTFNERNVAYNLTYSDSVLSNYTVGSEWTDYVVDVNILAKQGSDTEADTIKFNKTLNIAGDITIDSLAAPFFASSSDNDANNDTLNVVGELNAAANNTGNGSVIGTMNDTLYILLGGDSHILSSTIDTSGNGQTDAVQVIVEPSVSSTVSSTSTDIQADFHLKYSGITLDFEDKTIKGKFLMDEGITSSTLTAAEVTDSVSIGQSTTLNVVSDSVVFSSYVLVDTSASINNNGNNVYISYGTDAGAIFNVRSGANLVGSGKYRVAGGTGTADPDVQSFSN